MNFKELKVMARILDSISEELYERESYGNVSDEFKDSEIVKDFNKKTKILKEIHNDIENVIDKSFIFLNINY
tara:strand:+ start:239 stop:454 length:216 start_codon:yes stop_codon:yes gene_type:complete